MYKEYTHKFVLYDKIPLEVFIYLNCYDYSFYIK